VYLYSALYVVPQSQGAQAWITQCYLQLHQCLPLPRNRSLDGASTDWGCRHLIATYYSFIHVSRKEGAYDLGGCVRGGWWIAAIAQFLWRRSSRFDAVGPAACHIGRAVHICRWQLE